MVMLCRLRSCMHENNFNLKEKVLSTKQVSVCGLPLDARFKQCDWNFVTTLNVTQLTRFSIALSQCEHGKMFIKPLTHVTTNCLLLYTHLKTSQITRLRY